MKNDKAKTMDLEKGKVYVRRMAYDGRPTYWIEEQLQKANFKEEEIELLISDAEQYIIDYEYISIGKDKARNKMIIVAFSCF